MKKQYIIPIFVPHLGCPNDCVFCNQKSISGQQKMITKDDVKNTIEFYLDNIKDKGAKKEVAFFGGSFTGIEEEKQEEFLQTVYEYIKDGKIDSIRISTRPDYIDKKILKRLKKYKVEAIELGVQSANDYILKKCNRGHTFEDVKKASKLIRWYGFKLGHQMMVGLPESTRIDEINTAKELIKLKPKMVRIYPVLVIKNTKLEKDFLDEKYIPLTVVQAIETCKELVTMFNKKGIEVIRVGLQNTDEITDPSIEGSEVVAGPYHPAFRQLVESGLWYDTILARIKQLNVKVKKVEVIINPQDANNVIGHKKENIEKLKEIYTLDMIVKQDKNIKQGEKMKENKKIINILLIIVMILVVIACVIGYMYFTQEKEITSNNNGAIFSNENYPKIDGSTATLPLAEAFKSNFTGTDIKEVEVKHSKTHNAYVNLINGQTDLILVTYPSEDEINLAEEKNVELEIVPIVKEAFVFFVNKDNKVNNLSLTQIQEIYSGKIKNWKQVGGADAQIMAFQRPENSGSQSGMISLVMKGKKLAKPTTETVALSMADIIDVISDYNNKDTAIGYSYYYYATTMYTSDTMKLLAIDGVEPTYDNIKNGLYGIQTAYYAVIRKDEPENSNARKLLNAMKSERGQNVAKEAGYVQNY